MHFVFSWGKSRRCGSHTWGPTREIKVQGHELISWAQNLKERKAAVKTPGNVENRWDVKQLQLISVDYEWMTWIEIIDYANNMSSWTPGARKIHACNSTASCRPVWHLLNRQQEWSQGILSPLCAALSRLGRSEQATAILRLPQKLMTSDDSKRPKAPLKSANWVLVPLQVSREWLALWKVDSRQIVDDLDKRQSDLQGFIVQRRSKALDGDQLFSVIVRRGSLVCFTRWCSVWSSHVAVQIGSLS